MGIFYQDDVQTNEEHIEIVDSLEDLAKLRYRKDKKDVIYKIDLQEILQLQKSRNNQRTSSRQSPINQGTSSRQSPIPRIDEVVQISEWGVLEDLTVENGTVTVVDMYIDDPLPLWLTQEEINDWYIETLAEGGYVPFDGIVILYQLGAQIGNLSVVWTKGAEFNNSVYWTATFLITENIKLASSEYPDMIGFLQQDGIGQISENWVDIYFYFNWTNSQNFTILSVREKSSIHAN